MGNVIVEYLKLLQAFLSYFQMESLLFTMLPDRRDKMCNDVVI